MHCCLVGTSDSKKRCIIAAADKVVIRVRLSAQFTGTDLNTLLVGELPSLSLVGSHGVMTFMKRPRMCSPRCHSLKFKV